MDNAFRTFAIYNGEIIGGAIFLLQENIMEYHLSATTIIGKQLRAINLIFHEAFLYAQSKKYKFAHLGGGVTADHNDPLFIFKLSFAGQLAEYRIGKYIHEKQIYEELITRKLLQAR
jgi:lipid II:glycine glycyltransferase (peptidoglycan interpeptide bridge formation enzyme)